ncbi:hypothetical protein Tco_1285165 [Tanacetum coccineum]
MSLGKCNRLIYWAGRHGFPSHYRSREVLQLTQVCGSRDAFPSLIVPLSYSYHLPLVSYLYFSQELQLALCTFEILCRSGRSRRENLDVLKFPENNLEVLTIEEKNLEVLTIQKENPST